MARTQIGGARWALVAVFVALAAWRLSGTRGPGADPWSVVSILVVALVGITNALFTLPATAAVQGLTALVALAGLLRADWTVAVMLLLVFVAPPVFLLRWAGGRGPEPAPSDRAEAPARASRARWAMVGVILAVACASLAYRLLVAHRLEQTAALFIGIPTLLAIIVVLSGTPRSATGSICKAMTIALLMSGIALGEGVICILMAAPLFFAVGVMIGAWVDWTRRRFGERARNTAGCLALLVLLPLALEGVDDRLAWPRAEVVTASREVAASPDAIARQLARPPAFHMPLPAFLRLGFAQPTVTAGRGLSPGDRVSIRLSGAEGQPGDLVLDVIESRPGLIRLRPVTDESLVAYWLTWQEAEIRWAAAGDRGSRVTWILRYRRELDPIWYFGPWERYAVRLAAEYLIDNLATPR